MSELSLTDISRGREVYALSADVSVEAAIEQRERFVWCGTPIAGYPEHISDCPAVDVLESSEHRDRQTGADD